MTALGGEGVIDYSLQQLGLRLVAYVFIAGIHGFAVAAAAGALGDAGPRHDGRLRVNPLVHLDVIGTVSGVLFAAGWIRPIAIDPEELHMRGIAFRRLGLVAVVAAATGATLAGAAALRAVRPLLLPLLWSDSVSATAFALIETIGEQSLWFALVNLLPLPPLTGAHVLTAINPARSPAWRDIVRGLQPYGAAAIVVLAATGVLGRVLGPFYRLLAAAVFGE
jgi:Zn-dependent protease